ncbi:translation initiation factor Sui1 [Myxococcota bacterium]|nr:translation initiation factor Sui1 [Myxococcota bacterium]
MKRRGDRGIVYSSAMGRMCPQCGQPVAKCRCQTSPRAPQGDGIVRVRRERKGRKGKTVTTIDGLPLPSDELRKLARDLKRHCGSGGSLVDRIIEIQGDHVNLVIEELEARGYQVKRAGG